MLDLAIISKKRREQFQRFLIESSPAIEHTFLIYCHCLLYGEFLEQVGEEREELKNGQKTEER